MTIVDRFLMAESTSLIAEPLTVGDVHVSAEEQHQYHFCVYSGAKSIATFRYPSFGDAIQAAKGLKKVLEKVWSME